MAKEPELVTITKEELEALKSGKTELQEILKGLGNAIVESKKPYVDPGQEANEASMRESMKKQKQAQDRQKKFDQDSCPHKMASNPLSSTPDMFGRAAFWHFRLDTGEQILICSNCQKVVRQTDPEFVKFASMPTTNIAGSAGQRFFADPLAVIKAGQ